MVIRTQLREREREALAKRVLLVDRKKMKIKKEGGEFLGKSLETFAAS